MQPPLTGIGKYKSQIFLYSFVFFALLIYFYSSYKYYPGLKLTVNGEVEGEVEARIAWDFGKGFNTFDTLDFLLTAGVETETPLNQVTVEAAGIKNIRSKGYGITLLLNDTHIANERDFSIEGKHSWGDWANHHGTRGRWLFLDAGAKINLKIASSTLKIIVYPSYQSGVARVTSSHGLQRYYDCFGEDPYISTRLYYFGFKLNGEITHAIDQYKLSLTNLLYLPKQHISQIQFTTFPKNSINEVVPATNLTIRLAAMDSIGTLPSYSVLKIIINGQIIEWNDKRISLSKPSLSNGATLEPLKDFISFQGNILSFEIQVKNQNRDDIPFMFFLDGVEKDVARTFNTHHKVTTYQATSSYFTGEAVINSLKILDSKSQKHNIIFPKDSSDIRTIPPAQLSKIQQSRFHPTLFAIQTILAAVLTFLFYWFAQLPIVTQIGSFRQGIRLLFFANKHWFFWCILILGLSVNFLFLAAEWPGSLTPDSITVHKEIKWLQFSNHHPYIYSFLLLGFLHFFDSPVTAILAQIILFHALAAMFFCLLYQKGLSLYLLFPLALLYIFSIPINLFNITLWKDIPFTALILFWALLISYLSYQKYYCAKEIILNRRDAVLLSFLFFFLLTLRHNGIIFLPIVVFFIGILFWKQKQFLSAFLLCSALLLVAYHVLTPMVAASKKDPSNFAKHVITSRSSKMLSVLDAEKKYYLEDYVSDRLRLFMATLGTSPVADTWYTDTHNPPQRWHSVDEMRADMRFDPLSHHLSQTVRQIINSTTAYTGMTSGRFIFWNSLFAFIALASAFLLYKWLPISAIYSSFFLFQAMGMFFFVWPRWRYLYFIYVGGIFLLPIIALEISTIIENKRKRVVSRCR